MNSIVLPVEPSDTIKSIKSRLELLLTIPGNRQKILLDNDELRDNSTVESLQLKDEANLKLVRSDKAISTLESVNIRINTLDNHQHIASLSTNPANTVSMLKSELEKLENIPFGEQSLFFGNRILEDDKTLGSYSLPNEASLSLVIGKDLSKKKVENKISVQYSDHDSAVFTFDSATTVRMIRIRLSIILRHGIGENLYFGGQKLEDSHTLSSYGITENAVLKLAP